MTEDKVADRLKNAVQKLRLVVEVISEQALNRAILINDMSKDLENLTTNIEAKEAELTADLKELEEVEIEEVEESEKLTKIDDNPTSPTFGQEIDIA